MSMAKITKKYRYMINVIKVCLVGLMMAALVACDNNPFPHPKPGIIQKPVNQPKDSHGQVYLIGNLGGKPVNIPEMAVEGWVEYEGDPNDFDTSEEAKNYKRPPITYDLPITTLAFHYRLSDGAFMRQNDATEKAYRDDNERYVPKGEPLPWVSVIIYGVNDPKTPLNFNLRANEDIIDKSTTEGNGIWVNANYQPEPSSVPGLMYYQANKGIDPTTGKAWEKKEDITDIYIHKDARGDINTFIRCDLFNQGIHCNHDFFLSDMRVRVETTYNRHYLPQWQNIEARITQAIHSWVVQQTGQEFTTENTETSVSGTGYLNNIFSIRICPLPPAIIPRNSSFKELSQIWFKSVPLLLWLWSKNGSLPPRSSFARFFIPFAYF